MITDLPKEWHRKLQQHLFSSDPSAVLCTEETIPPKLHSMVPSLIGAAKFVLDEVAPYIGLRANVYFCAVLSRDFQACAVKLSENEFCILIWVGCQFQLESSLSRMIRTKPVASWFGLNLRENYEASGVLGEDTWSAYRALGELGHLTPRESDPASVEGLIAESLIDAFRWLVCHEIGHIANGHLDFAPVQNGLRAIVEYSDAAREEDRVITDHTLEMDADAFATWRTALSVLRRPSLAERNGDPIRGTIPLERLRTFAFGSFAMVRSFDARRTSDDMIFSTDHPPAWLRLQMIWGLLEAPAFMSATRTTPEDAEAFMLGQLEMESGIYEATGLDGRGGNARLIIAAREQQYRSRLNRRWATLRPSLEAAKLTNGNLAPASEPPDKP